MHDLLRRLNQSTIANGFRFDWDDGKDGQESTKRSDVQWEEGHGSEHYIFTNVKGGNENVDGWWILIFDLYDDGQQIVRGIRTYPAEADPAYGMGPCGLFTFQGLLDESD